MLKTLFAYFTIKPTSLPLLIIMYKNVRDPTLPLCYYVYVNVPFSKELDPVLFDVYDSWGRLGTMVVTFRTETKSFIYRKSDNNDIANYRPI